MSEAYLYRSKLEHAELGDICEFDIEIVKKEWSRKPGQPPEFYNIEEGIEGEVTKLLPKGRLRIRYEDPAPKRGERRIKSIVRPAAECELIARSM